MLPPIAPLRPKLPPSHRARAPRRARVAKPRPIRRRLAGILLPYYQRWGPALGFLLGCWIAFELLLPLSG